MRYAFNLRPVFIEYFFGGKPATELSGRNYFNIFSRRKLIFLAELIFSVTLCARRHGKIRLVTDITERRRCVGVIARRTVKIARAVFSVADRFKLTHPATVKSIIIAKLFIAVYSRTISVRNNSGILRTSH